MVGAIEHDFTQTIMAASAYCGGRGTINRLFIGRMVERHLALKTMQPGETAVVCKRGMGVR